MKKINKILMGILALSILTTFLNLNTALAVEEPTIPVISNTHQHRVQANNSIMFCFQNRTRIRFNSTVNIDVNINCDAFKIGIKDFELEIDHHHDLQMNMTCTEEQSELGLLKGNRYKIRNQNRVQYQEGFCISIECNCSCEMQAKLKIKATNQNRAGMWAYYDENSDSWVAVHTELENGYLVSETDHFSYWTVLIPDSDENIPIYVGIGILSFIGSITLVSVVFH
ncbi:MAG: hypothetical protein ACXACB_07160, partial [Promethearchaeota archaeon]